MPNPQPDRRVSQDLFRWEHPEHGTVVCTQRELYRQFGLDPRPINNVARHGKPSYRGWKAIGPTDVQS